jgi:RHS repeat-associated protein
MPGWFTRTHHRLSLAATALGALALVTALLPGLGRHDSRAFAQTNIERSPGLHFSSAPADEEFLRTGLFVQPLVPVRGTTTEENAQLARALTGYAHATPDRGRDSVRPLEQFLAERPMSAWAPSLQVGLGWIYRSTGRFSKALDAWQTAWTSTKDLKTSHARTVGDEAVGYLSQMEAYLGRKEQLRPLLADTRARGVHGSAAELVSQSASGLSDMESHPEVAFKCGPSALARILALHPTKDSAKSLAVLQAAHSTPSGLSLMSVQAFSVDADMNYQMAFRSAGAPVVVPAVAHWRVGHYAALLGRDPRGGYLVSDATFGENVTMSRATLDEEASGYFLVPAGPLPTGWRPVGAAEGDSVWGRGDTGSNDDIYATGRQEIHAFDKCPDGGCTSWNVEAMVVGLSLHDEPLGYKPPFGPRIRLQMDYSYRDAMQPGTFTYTNFGNKWTTNFISYVADDAGCAGFYGSAQLGRNVGYNTIQVVGNDCAMLYRQGGGGEPYSFPSSDIAPAPGGSWTSSLGEFSQAVLTKNFDLFGATKNFVRTLPDGSTETFGYAMGGGVDASFYGGTKYFMTQFTDPQGNAVNINYDSLYRITSVVDAMNQPTWFCYNDSYPNHGCNQPIAGQNPSSNLVVTQVIDPFQRSAYFGYQVDPSDSSVNRLVSIKDVLGIVSNYTYQSDPKTGNLTDFVEQLYIPQYGLTQFQFTDATGETSPLSTRSVTTTDPLNRVSRVEFHQSLDLTPACTAQNAQMLSTGVDAGAVADRDGISCSDGGAYLPQLPATALALANSNLQYRNTFVWDPYQYNCQENADDFCYTNCAKTASNPGGYCYANAKVIHWLHANQGDPTQSLSSDTNPMTASRIPESVKAPLETRVWYEYESQGVQQQDPAFSQAPTIGVGSTNQPTVIARTDENGISQVWQYLYNGYGHVTQVTDPIGRQTTFVYENGIDLNYVTNTSPGHNDYLLSLQDYNGHHMPQGVQGANWGVTNYLYNGAGQVKSRTDPLGNMWTYAYEQGNLPNDSGYLATVTGPAPEFAQYQFTYDGVGRVLTAKDPSGEVLTYSYDAADRLTNILYPDQSSVVLGHVFPSTSPYAGMPSLDLVSVTDRRGNTTIRQYDQDRQLTEIDEPAGRTTKLTYWPNGALATIQDPVQNVSHLDTDLEGRRTAVVYANGTGMAYAYDGAGRLSAYGEITANGQNALTFGYAYNADNTVQVFYDNLAMSPTTFAYDPAYPRLIGWSKQPATGVLTKETLTYAPIPAPGDAPNPGANLLQNDTVVTGDITNANVVSTTSKSYSYDELGRAIGAEFTFDAPNPYGVPVPYTMSESWSYDTMGRLTGDKNPVDNFVYGYKDATTRVSSRTSAAGPQIRAAYLPATNDGLLQTLTYSTVPSGGTTQSLAAYSYSYDANHNVTSFSETYPGSSSTLNYGYDAYNQLTSSRPPGILPTSATSYGHDLAGDLTSDDVSSQLLSGNSVTSWTPGPSNEILTQTSGGTTVNASYDAYGNLQALGATPVYSYSYDALNRLTQVSYKARETLAGGRSVIVAASTSFAYDPLGRLVQVVDKVGGSVTANHTYAWCGSVRCAEFDNTALMAIPGTPQLTPKVDKFYYAQGFATPSGDSLILNPPPGSPGFLLTTSAQYYVTDELGSVREVVSPSGGVELRYEYADFGARTTSVGTAPENDFGFGGYFYNNTTGLSFARARVYDSGIGRWLTRDPIGNRHAFRRGPAFNGTDLNLYAYCSNNPVSCLDPSGEFGVSLGGNVGYAAGAGVGSGGYIEIGLFFNSDTLDLDVYEQLANANDGPGIGLEYGAGLSGTVMANAADFYGTGYEASLDFPADIPLIPVDNVQVELDDQLHAQGLAAGRDLGKNNYGGGLFTYKTDTWKVASVRGILSAVAHACGF